MYRLTFALLVVCWSSQPSLAETFYSYANGKRYSVTVTEEALKKAPAWKPDADDPPLSARKAIKVADAVRVRIAPNREGGRWRLESIGLIPDSGGWYWRANYDFISKGISTGPAHQVRLAVLMDGTVVEPVVTDRKEQK